MKVTKANAGASVPATQKVKAAKGGMMAKMSKEKAKAIPKKAMAKKATAKAMAGATMGGGGMDKSYTKNVMAYAKGGMAKKKGC